MVRTDHDRQPVVRPGVDHADRHLASARLHEERATVEADSRPSVAVRLDVFVAQDSGDPPFPCRIPCRQLDRGVAPIVVEAVLLDQADRERRDVAWRTGTLHEHLHHPDTSLVQRIVVEVHVARHVPRSAQSRFIRTRVVDSSTDTEPRDLASRSLHLQRREFVGQRDSLLVLRLESLFETGHAFLGGAQVDSLVAIRRQIASIRGFQFVILLLQAGELLGLAGAAEPREPNLDDLATGRPPRLPNELAVLGVGHDHLVATTGPERGTPEVVAGRDRDELRTDHDDPARVLEDLIHRDHDVARRRLVVRRVHVDERAHRTLLDIPLRLRRSESGEDEQSDDEPEDDTTDELGQATPLSETRPETKNPHQIPYGT